MKPVKDDKEMNVNVAREWGKFWLGIALAVFGMGIVAFSLIVPPVGAIHASVVTTFGTILTFIGAIFGVDSNAKIRMHGQDMDFELKKQELDEKIRRFDRRFEEAMKEDKEEELE